MKILGVIPARYASSRFPGKPLADILGKSMIERVYLQAKQAKSLAEVIVATDNNKIYQHVVDFGGEACLTKETHPSGTDRCGEVLAKNPNYDAVVNIQGDEPLINPEQIEQLAQALINGASIATLCKGIDNEEEKLSPNVVKVVKSLQHKALYFSRSSIPFNRENNNDVSYFKHIGLYAYTAQSLKQIVNLKSSALEQTEMLEQLRWLENDLEISVLETPYNSIGVDTPEDINKILTLLAR